jgi:hypothetical protein
MSKMLVTILFCGLCAYFALFAVKKRAFGVDSFFNQEYFWYSNNLPDLFVVSFQEDEQ